MSGSTTAYLSYKLTLVPVLLTLLLLMLHPVPSSVSPVTGDQSSASDPLSDQPGNDGKGEETHRYDRSRGGGGGWDGPGDRWEEDNQHGPSEGGGDSDHLPEADNSKRSVDNSVEDIETGAISTEKILIKKLLERYEHQGRVGRPVIHTNDNLTVYFGLSLIQILDVDETNQVLKTNIWYHYKWRDVLLTWNMSEHDNIDNIRIPSKKIWLPDILLYNFADDRLQEQRDALVVVESNGELLWMPQAILRSSCLFDTLYFPFDSQECRLKFGSWTYNGEKLNIDFVADHHMDTSDFVPSNEWDILKNKAKRNVKYYTCCPEPYPDLTFTLKLKRKVAFYTFILVLPCALLSLLTLVIFWVPPESPAKLQLGMSIFVAFFFLLLVLAESTPRAAASVPLIGAYFCLSMILITVSTVLACIVANMFFRGVRINRAPKWLRVCTIKGIATLLCLRNKITEPPEQVFEPRTANQYRETKNKYPEKDVRFSKVRLMDNGLDYRMNNTQTEGSDLDSFLDRHGFRSGAILEEVRSIREILEKSQEKQRKHEERDRYVREWRVIACVTDRFFFLIYVIINIVGITVIFKTQ